MSRSLLLRSSVTLGATLLFAEPATAQTVPPAEQQITAATLPLPEPMRAGATVLGYRTAGRLETLRRGTNGMTCLAHNPSETNRFHVACYHESLEPFMARGRALRAEGKTPAQVDTVRFAEVAKGTLKMPTSGALYSLTGPAGDYDPVKKTAPKSKGLFVMYMPGATQESTGLTTTPRADGPWLMLPGTPKAHIMFTLTM
ncbi:MAG: hypothetical protein MUD17_05370 [Gemmatimonadaceae bacterium]|jgi:hypothetical protein|nr:hypothetical protein [Gemmatimonadaceae bacterium]